MTEQNCMQVLKGKLKKTDHLAYIDVSGKIVLK
jgi:hypothetical protein